MIQTLVDQFLSNEQKIRDTLAQRHIDEYKELVRLVVEHVAASPDPADGPDPERIHQIDDGDYQGTLVFVIGERGYQPSDYWYVRVGYGSCSGCDTLAAISDYSSEPPTPEQVNDYWTLALHIVQGLTAMQAEEV